MMISFESMQFLISPFGHFKSTMFIAHFVVVHYITSHNQYPKYCYTNKAYWCRRQLNTLNNNQSSFYVFTTVSLKIFKTFALNLTLILYAIAMHWTCYICAKIPLILTIFSKIQIFIIGTLTCIWSFICGFNTFTAIYTFIWERASGLIKEIGE